MLCAACVPAPTDPDADEGAARAAEKRLHVLMQKVHTIRNDKNKKRKEAHAESLRLQAKRMAKKEEALNQVRIPLVPPCPSSLCVFSLPGLDHWGHDCGRLGCLHVACASWKRTVGCMLTRACAHSIVARRIRNATGLRARRPRAARPRSRSRCNSTWL